MPSVGDDNWSRNVQRGDLFRRFESAAIVVATAQKTWQCYM